MDCCGLLKVKGRGSVSIRQCSAVFFSMCMFKTLFILALHFLMHQAHPVCAAAFQPTRRRYYHYATYIQEGRHHTTSPLFYTIKHERVQRIAANKKYLTQKLGLPKNKVEKLQEMDGLPNILTLDEGILEERVLWLKQRLKLKNKGQIRGIVQHQPHVLARLSSNLEQKIDYLQTRLLLDDKSLRKLILDAPHILPCSTDNIEETLNWLQTRLSLDDRKLSKLVKRAPYTLGCSVDENLEPTLDWLQRRLGMDDFSISRVVQKMPRILHLNIESNLEPKLDWLQEEFKLDDEAVGKMVQRAPTIIGLAIDSWEIKIDWIQSRLGLVDQDLADFVLKSPSILNLTCQNLDSTLQFFIDALGNERDAVRLVTNNPSLLAYSLERRLKPRLQETRDLCLQVDASCLRRIGQYSDDYWKAATSFVRDHQEFGITVLP